ncbi:hypothetical protein [Haloarchaeobius sp. DFWS5]|uniref:hypothetical protein n=1 Tax=Haloarchaeobius sp. DFWS5 TaxID=3446114 RepID=UPI003EC15407
MPSSSNSLSFGEYVDSEIVRRIMEQYRTSVSLKVAAFGAGLIAFAFGINFVFGMTPAIESSTGFFDLWGLWAAIFSIWGGAMLVVGLLTYSIVWLKRQ